MIGPMPRSALLVLLAFLSTAVAAADRLRVDGIEIGFSVRTPEQIVAFYTGRGMPVAAAQRLAAHCMVTVGIENGRDDIVWLEPARWRYTDAKGKSVARLNRAYWNKELRRLKVPAANRATFGWTQLPERRDLQPSEPVGGNVLLDAAGPVRIEAIFPLGTAREKELKLPLPPLECPARETRS